MAVTDRMISTLLQCVRPNEQALACKEFVAGPDGWKAIVVAWSIASYPIFYEHFKRLCHSNFFEGRDSDEDFCELLARSDALDPNFVSLHDLARAGAGLNDEAVRQTLGLLKLQAFPTRKHLKRFMEKQHEDQLAQARALPHDLGSTAAAQAHARTWSAD